MRLGLFLYKAITLLITPFIGLELRSRVRRGKEAAQRIHERKAENLLERPKDRLVWLHGASVGETQILLELICRLDESVSAPTNYLLTCQTQTASKLIEESITKPPLSAVRVIHNMAPLDSPDIVKRFCDNWKPDLAIFAEGEVWPNILFKLKEDRVVTVLLNARMTDDSIRGWLRWPKTAKMVFDCFDVLLASDLKTQTGLEAITHREIECTGNLKSALPLPSSDAGMLLTLKDKIGDRKVLLAASTHTGEEAIALDAYMRMPDSTFMIIAPRHPERGDEVDALLSCTRYAISRRSEGDPITSETNILLADTMGEMGLWYELADTVYLGGGHTPGVGGHNPLEALRLGKPILTGPSLFNFSDLSEKLLPHEGFTVIEDAEALQAAFPAEPVSQDLRNMLERESLGPITATLDALAPLLKHAGLME